MTSLFDQLERVALQPSKTASDLQDLGDFPENDVAIFTKTKKDFAPCDKITHVAISNKFMAVAMANNVLLRISLHSPSEKSEIQLSKYSQNRLGQLFLDPAGNHLLLGFVPRNRTTDAPELMYLARKSDKIKPCHKLRGNEFTAVAWNRSNESEIDSGPILLGTSKGLIIETEILFEDDKFFSHTLEQYWKQVFDIGKNTNTPVCALDYFQVGGDVTRYVIFAATPTRLYHFIGRGAANHDEKPALQHVFHRYLHQPEIDTFLAADGGSGWSRLQFWCENSVTPDAFVWTTDKGAYYGQIDVTRDEKMASIKEKTKFLEYSRAPIALAMTEFHVLLGYPDGIKGVCLLSGDVIYEDVYNEAFGRLVGVVRDVRTGAIWAVSENAMFRFKVHRETRDIWRIYCANQQFELAKKYSKDNDACYNQVLIREAETLFEAKEYVRSAHRFADSRASFEGVCLRYIEAEQWDALRVFLRQKLGNLQPDNKTQITMIVMWVVELFLSKLDDVRGRGLAKSAIFDAILKEFEAFLALQAVADCIKTNKTTMYELMESHGDADNLIKLTIVNKDFERLVRHQVFKGDFFAALDVLKSQNNAELYYQFAPILMREVTKATVRTLIEQGRKLSAARLLPALVACAGDLHALEVIRYLEFCVGKLKNTDRAIHNLLLSLYAKCDRAKLMDYLNAQGQDLSLINYDVYFALNLCAEHGLKSACVKLYTLLGLWESAVDLALEIDLALAKNVADMPPKEDAELQKKLWLKIVKHAVSDRNDIQEAMKYFRELFNNDVIKIEDILPFFPDFVTIDHFKDAICDSLKEYNAKINALKLEMEEATKSAEQVRNDIQSFRNGYVRVDCLDVCAVCRSVLMLKPFHLFPCGHLFHSDCLHRELEPFLGLVKRNRLAELEKHLQALQTQTNSDSASTGSVGITTLEQIKAEIDHIVASECLYCGENMIRNIDKPFIDDHNYEAVIKEWQ